MDYVVLARKLRPTRFEHLIGQDTVVRALKNALLTDRVAHAFLFAGARGVGKTSTARILTKALNCAAPEQGEPCNACDNCREIAQNASPDVFEIDAASNRGIDNIRELRENTKYTPAKSRYKTYIIDEVHMLTMESFNALLKTLEEPPAHVKFILATTNPHRIPDTILSRCQRYDFARIPVIRLADYLAEVTARESLRLSRAALEAIARNAAGSVRDALTAVDQVVSYAGSEAGDDQVWRILGLTDNREVFTLLDAILTKSLPDALAALAETRDRGHDLEVLLEALIREIKDFSLYLSLDGQPARAADTLPEALAFYGRHRAGVTLDELQQLFYLLLEVEGQLKRSEFAQACFEMGLVKACRVQPLVGVSELLTRLGAVTAGQPAPEEGRTARPPGRPERANPQPPARAAASRAAPATPTTTAPAGAPRGREGSHAAVSGRSDRSPGEDPEEGEPAPPAAAALSAPTVSLTVAPPLAQPDDPLPPGPEGPPLVQPDEPLPPEPDAPPSDSAPPPREPPSSPQPVRTADATPTEPAAGTPPADAPSGETAPEETQPGEIPRGELPPGDVSPGAPGPMAPALCDDPRWRAFVERAAAVSSHLGAKLRLAEVGALEDGGVEVIPADPANGFSPGELERLAPALEEDFGPAFHIRLNDDKKRKARDAHTIAGRNRLEAQALLAARRAAAENDASVQRLLRFFPKARVVDVSLSEPADPNRSDDV